MTYMRVCDACTQPIDPADQFIELVGPTGQRHYHENGICWPTVTAAIDDAQREARRLVRAAAPAAAPPG